MSLGLSGPLGYPASTIPTLNESALRGLTSTYVVYGDTDGSAAQDSVFWYDSANSRLVVPKLAGNSTSAATLTLASTTHASKGYVYLGSSSGAVYDETNITFRCGTFLGSASASGTVTIKGTSHATAGFVYLGSSTTVVVDEVNKRLGVGAAPSYDLHVVKNLAGDVTTYVNNGAANGRVLSTFHSGSTYFDFRVHSQSWGGGSTYFGLADNGLAIIPMISGTTFAIGSYNAAPFVIGTNNVEAIRWDTNQYTILNSRLQGKKAADLASATTLTVGAGNFVSVTGTTTISYITTTGWQAGSMITLQFTGSLTVNHAAGAVPANTAAIHLSAAGSFSATANDTLTLVYNGTVWVEVARTVI